jgi:drug/metabolite transporter (DMT)-like permease
VNSAKRTLDGRAMAILVSLCFLWGLAQVSIKFANRGVSPIFQAAVRSITASILVALWARVRGLPLIHRDRTLLHGLAVGLMFGTEFVCIYLSLSYTTASHAAVLLYTAPFFVALGAHWFLPHEPLTGRKVAGLVLAFFGVVITLQESLGRPTGLQILGDLLSLLGGGLWAATSLYLKGIVRTRMTPSQMLFYQLGFSAVQLYLMSRILEPHPIRDLSPLVLASLAYQGIVVAFASYLIWFWLIQVYPVSNLSAFTFCTPIFGVLLAGLLLHESISLSLLAGAGLVAGGMILVNWPEKEWGKLGEQG